VSQLDFSQEAQRSQVVKVVKVKFHDLTSLSLLRRLACAALFLPAEAAVVAAAATSAAEADASTAVEAVVPVSFSRAACWTEINSSTVAMVAMIMVCVFVNEALSAAVHAATVELAIVAAMARMSGLSGLAANFLVKSEIDGEHSAGHGCSNANSSSAPPSLRQFRVYFGFHFLSPFLIFHGAHELVELFLRVFTTGGNGSSNFIFILATIAKSLDTIAFVRNEILQVFFR
jgi:hypothetical protein